MRGVSPHLLPQSLFHVASSLPAAHNKSPLYHSIAGAVRSLIACGELKAGAQLPTIAAMAKRYNVAPVTVREAFRLLTQEGLIRGRRGSGTFVNEAPPRLTSPVTEAGWPQLPQNLRDHRGRILETDDAPPPLLPHEGTLAAAYRRMRRVHLDERSEPFRVVELFVARHYYDQAPRRFDQEMALVVLEELDAVHLDHRRRRSGGASGCTCWRSLGAAQTLAGRFPRRGGVFFNCADPFRSDFAVLVDAPTLAAESHRLSLVVGPGGP